jgi:hypothetical protein
MLPLTCLIGIGVVVGMLIMAGICQWISYCQRKKEAEKESDRDLERDGAREYLIPKEI